MKRKMKPVHPGTILREDVFKQLGLSTTRVAKSIGVSRKELSEIVKEVASISPTMAIRLENCFGINAEFWLDLQKKYDISKVLKS